MYNKNFLLPPPHALKHMKDSKYSLKKKKKRAATGPSCGSRDSKRAVAANSRERTCTLAARGGSSQKEHKLFHTQAGSSFLAAVMFLDVVDVPT